jgi:hypothetical protein
MPLSAAERESEAPHIEWRAWRTSGRAVPLDLSIGPSVVPPALGQLDARDARSRVVLAHGRNRGLHEAANGLEPVPPCGRPFDFGKHFLDVPAL